MSGTAPRLFCGIGASPGVVVGEVYLLHRGPVRVPRHHVPQSGVDREVARLDAGIDRSAAQLAAIRARFKDGGTDHQAILEAHEMMLRDRVMLEETRSLIRREQLCAEWAVSRVIARVRALFDRVSNTYFRDRRGDIDFVGDRILRNLAGQHTDLADLGDLGDTCVIVAHDLSPADTTLLNRQNILAFVTEVDGKTSHTSIIARSMAVPAVVGLVGILDAACSGDAITVDGLDGTVVLRPSRKQVRQSHARAARFAQATHDVLQAAAGPACTRDGHRVHVAGNIEHPGEAPNVLARGGEGIGLYRTEFMFVDHDELPSEDNFYRAYRRVLEHVGSHPVTVRTLDTGTDKPLGFLPLQAEPNPALGLRAIRFCLQHRGLFAAQMAGLLRAAVHGQVRIMLPMVSGIEELRQARALLAEVARSLARRGEAFARDVPLGIMVEVPSAAMTCDLLAVEADFFAVGTNDLIQYLLAIDRTNERVAYLYQPAHPAVLRCLHAIAQAAKKARLPVSVCGEMAGDTKFTPVLLGLGFDQLSVNAGAIANVKRLIREVHLSDCHALVRDMLACSCGSDAEDHVRGFLLRHVPFANSIVGPLC